jgi:NodT family efflux transporter outer membrane factor (OMF) lipoprotein
MKPFRLVVSLAVGLVLLPGCTVGPDYIAPEPAVPDAWFQAATAGVEAGTSPIQTWWTTLNDPTLDALIKRAVDGNLDLRAALRRIDQARAVRGIATGALYPDVDAGGFAARERLSEDLGGGKTDNFAGVGIDGTWEIDVWGRIKRLVESSDAELDASVEDYRDVLVILYASVAANYIELRTFQERLAYAESNVVTQEQTLQLTVDRRDAQLAPELDVQQAELNLATTESFVPVLRQGIAQTIYRISVLLGEPPQGLWDELVSTAPIPAPPAEVGVGVPVDVVRQRPDIRRAERVLAARTADIGVATADLYPRFSLSGAFAFEGTSDILDASNKSWSFGPAFRWNLFDGGRVRNRIELRDAEAEEAFVRYEQTVLLALEDVESALVAYTEERKRRDTLARSVDAANQSVELVKTLYRTGLTDFQNVKDSERSLFLQQDELATSEGLVTRNLVEIYRALGGGWEPDPEPLAVTREDMEQGEPIF